MTLANNQDDLITVREAARKCRRNPETVRRWIWSGKVRAEKIGNQLFIKQCALESYCKEINLIQYLVDAEADFLERAIALQNRIMARGGEPSDSAEIIRKMREERSDELL